MQRLLFVPSLLILASCANDGLDGFAPSAEALTEASTQVLENTAFTVMGSVDVASTSSTRLGLSGGLGYLQLSRPETNLSLRVHLTGDVQRLQVTGMDNDANPVVLTMVSDSPSGGSVSGSGTINLGRPSQGWYTLNASSPEGVQELAFIGPDEMFLDWAANQDNPFTATDPLLPVVLDDEHAYLVHKWLFVDGFPCFIVSVVISDAFDYSCPLLPPDVPAKICFMQLLNNCEVDTGVDADGDGFDDTVDCNDSDATIYPGADEYCDGVDNDCDGTVDESDAIDALAWFADADGDGYGEPASWVYACEAPVGFVADSMDCDDSDSTVNPGATEICGDGIDQDCDGLDPACSDCGGTILDLGAGDLVITEIMQNPAQVSDSYGEYFELLNMTDSCVDLEGLLIYDLGADSFTVAGSLQVEAGSFLVLGKEGDMALNGNVAVDYVYGTQMSLSNGDDEVYLDNGVEIIDGVAYDGGPSFPDPTGASMNLDSASYSDILNDDGAYWCESATALGSDFGTPGAENDACF